MTALVRFCLLMIALIGLVLAPSAASQPDAEELVSGAISRMSVIDLRQQPTATFVDYQIAAAMLEIAIEVTPQDVSLLRRLIEAHRAAGNEDAVMEATRKLLRVDPKDTVAQLRLLSWNVSKKQTVQDRLAVYTRYLSEDAIEAIPDPAVRSRLALDAALLYREQGDDREFVRHLAMATSLDSSNKEAAALAAAFYQERRDDPVGNLELAINLLRADPVDPNLYFGVAAELAKHGEFTQAQRFHDSGRRLIATDGITNDTGIDMETTVLRWHNYGADRVINEFEQLLQIQRENAKMRVDQLVEAEQSTENVTKPEDVRLPIHNERIRVLAAAAAGDTVVLERSLTDLTNSIRPVLEDIAERLQTPVVAQDIELQATLLRQAATLGSELIVSNLVVGSQSDSVISDVAMLRALLGGSADDQLAVIDSFVVLRQGRVDEAIALFEPLSQISTLGSVGYGLALEAAGRNDEAAEAFKTTALFSQVTPIGAYARVRYEQLSGKDLVYSEHTAAVRSVAEAVPDWFDSVAGNPNRMMSVTVSLESQTIDSYKQPVIQLNIRNTAPIALAVGSDRPINSRLMISPALTVGSYSVSAVLKPEIFDMHHRIRLVPGESLTLRIWPDPGTSGWIADLKAASTVRSRWNLLQGFVVGDGQMYKAGPMCISAETPLLTREPDQRIRSSLSDLARELELYEEDRVIALLPTIRAALIDPDRPTGPATAEEISRIASVLASRYPAFSQRGRIAIAAIAPHRILCPGMETLDSMILSDTDPVVLAVGIFSRVQVSTAPALARAAASNNPKLSLLANNLISRLEQESPTGFAFMPPIGTHKPAAPMHEEAIEP
jgi:tetratricopeptide (TPR) repeat protein